MTTVIAIQIGVELNKKRRNELENQTTIADIKIYLSVSKIADSPRLSFINLPLIYKEYWVYNSIKTSD